MKHQRREALLEDLWHNWDNDLGDALQSLRDVLPDCQEARALNSAMIRMAEAEDDIQIETSNDAMTEAVDTALMRFGKRVVIFWANESCQTDRALSYPALDNGDLNFKLKEVANEAVASRDSGKV